MHGDLDRAPAIAELCCCADEKPSARIVDCARIKAIRAQSTILYENPRYRRF